MWIFARFHFQADAGSLLGLTLLCGHLILGEAWREEKNQMKSKLLLCRGVGLRAAATAPRTRDEECSNPRTVLTCRRGSSCLFCLGFFFF